MESVKLPDPHTVYQYLSPIASNGIPKRESAKIIDVGSHQFIDFFNSEILNNFVLDGGSTCRFFEGISGSGKSHLLRLIEDYSLDNGFVVCHTPLYKEQSFDRWDGITRHILENMCIRDNGREIIGFSKILEYVGQTKQLKRHEYRNEKLSHPCFQNAIVYALNRSSLDYRARLFLNDYLSGKKVSVREMKYAGLRRIKKPLSQRNAEQVLNTVLNSIYLLGLKGTILTFDETDNTWTRQQQHVPKKIQVAANMMRRFVDGCTSGEIMGTTAIFGVLPSFMIDCYHCYPALGQRIQNLSGPNVRPGWRWHLSTPIEINSHFIGIDNKTQQHTIFLDKAVERFWYLVKYCGGRTDGLEKELLEKGREVLQNNVGEHYRRDVIRALSTVCVNRIRESGEPENA